MRVLAIQADLAKPVGKLAANRDGTRNVIAQVERRDVALLHELRGNRLCADLCRGRHIVEIGVLRQRVEAIVVYRPVCKTEHCLGKAAVIERALRPLSLSE